MAKGKYKEWLKPEKLTLLEGWARDGLTDEQIAKNIGIRRETFIEWKKKYPNISNTIKKGKEVIDYEVENALLKAALGFEYEETVTEKNGDKVLMKKMKRYAQPNSTALIFWLKNRRPDKWRDKPAEVFVDEATEQKDELSKSLEELAQQMEGGVDFD